MEDLSPFEALRLGHRVIANDLNPVAAVILHATLDFPLRFGKALTQDIEHWGERLIAALHERVDDLFPQSFRLLRTSGIGLKRHLSRCPTLISQYDKEYPVITSTPAKSPAPTAAARLPF